MVLFLLGLTLRLGAQKVPSSDQLPQNFDIVANLQDLQRQLGELAASTTDRQQQIISKLDQVLANQESILKELDVVKIRASRGGR